MQLFDQPTNPTDSADPGPNRDGRRDELAELLGARRRELGMSLQQLGERAGCARSYLSMLESGRRTGDIGEELLVRLEGALAMSPGALRRAAAWRATPPGVKRRVKELGESQRCAAAALRAILESGGAAESGVASGEGAAGGRGLDEAYRSGRLRALITRLEDTCEGERGAGPRAASLSAAMPRQVPLINSVAAGYPREFTDLGFPARVADEYVRTPDIDDPDAFAARVVGDSMLPDYREGDIVVFSPARTVSSGMDCFVRLERDEQTTFKRVFLEGGIESASDEGAEGVGEERAEWIRLVALNSAYAERRVRREEVAGLYAAVSVTRRIGG